LFIAGKPYPWRPYDPPEADPESERSHRGLLEAADHEALVLWIATAVVWIAVGYVVGLSMADIRTGLLVVVVFYVVGWIRRHRVQ
jgi:hypothetical protein